MSLRYNKQQTAEFIKRTEKVTRYFFENRDIKLTIKDIAVYLGSTRMGAQGVVDRILASGDIDMFYSSSYRFYKWHDTSDNKLLKTFMANSRMRARIREFNACEY